MSQKTLGEARVRTDFYVGKDSVKKAIQDRISSFEHLAK